MKRVQPKFKPIWQKIVARRPADEPLQPFPGSSLLRWAVTDAVIGSLKYEGKPSTQALKLAASLKQGSHVTEFDKAGPFMLAMVYPDKSFKFVQVDWSTWNRYHDYKEAAKYYSNIFKGGAGAGI